jgi:hypothetical protein
LRDAIAEGRRNVLDASVASIFGSLSEGLPASRPRAAYFMTNERVRLGERYVYHGELTCFRRASINASQVASRRNSAPRRLDISVMPWRKLPVEIGIGYP